MSEDKYYSKDVTVYVCKECGKEWDVPGAAESCYNGHRLQDALESVNNHKKLYIDDVIDVIEQMVDDGEFDHRTEQDES